ncbi:MAG: AEC family transporter, partial [Thermodesulfobacteriota bacterium]|nr:AEC family transporter [Thermodesulfobacteriota bacterium]
MIKEILTFPPVICLLAALALRSVSLPDSFILFLKKLAATLVPVVIIAVGFQLTLQLSADVLKPM